MTEKAAELKGSLRYLSPGVTAVNEPKCQLRLLLTRTLLERSGVPSKDKNRNKKEERYYDRGDELEVRKEIYGIK